MIRLLPDVMSAVVCTVAGIAAGCALMAVLTISGRKKGSANIALAYADPITILVFPMSIAKIIFCPAFYHKSVY